MYFREMMNVVCESNVGMEKFVEQLDAQRNKMYNPVFPTNCKEKYSDIEEIKNIESGEYDITYKNINIKWLLQKRKSDKLYVFFNGAAGLDGMQKDKYQRWSWGSLVDANVLNILDPMYSQYENLPIGWYWGSKDLDYRQIVSDMIMKVADMLEVPYSNIILYGSSAGGTASIYMAHYIKGCTAVALNPQIRPWKHEWHDKFKSIVGIDTEENDIFHRSDVEWHIKNSPESKYIIIVNCRSRRDYNWQMVPLAQKLNINIQYGLSQYDNLFTWIFDTGRESKHSALEYSTVFVAIDNVINKIKKNEWLDEIKDEVYLINEFWREHWDNK